MERQADPLLWDEDDESDAAANSQLLNTTKK
jgi:hypothetical protein